MDLRFHYFAAAQTARANAHALVALGRLGVHRTKIDVPAPFGDVVRVADFITRERLLAADLTNLCHG